jgi:uncharacterized protein YgbK (DUF1537 family)
VDGEPVPVNQTEFARDSVFGYHHAYLPDYVEEKTQGRVRAEQVIRFDLDAVRGDLGERLLALSGNACCVVDAESQPDLDGFARQVLTAASEGKRFLFRSAASLLTALAALPPQPVAAAEMSRFVRGGRPGVVLMGSHVATSSRQLDYLIKNSDVLPVLIDLDHLIEDEDRLLADILGQLEGARTGDRGAVLYTSRGERQFPSKVERLAFGERVSAFLVRIVQNLPPDLGFLISKGGITSNDTLSKGLALRTARVLGQVRAGCSVVRCPADHPRFPDLPVVIFPGNVGGEEALAEVYRILSRPSQGLPAGQRDAA